MDRVWQELSVYESHDILATRFKARHGWELNAEKAREIASHVAQARQYFEAGSRSDLLTRPLLLYYGSLALARGLALFSSRNLRECALSPGHGLHTIWTQSIQRGAELLDVEIEISSRGTFCELQTATASTERVPVILLPFPRQIGEASVGSGNTPGRRVTLRDVVSRLPSALDVYADSLGGQAHCFLGSKCEVAGSGTAYTDVFILASRNGVLWAPEHVRRELFIPEKIALLRSTQFFDIGYWHLFFRIEKNSGHPDYCGYELPGMLLNPMQEPPPGLPISPFWIATPIDGDIRLTSIEQLFVVAFALGTLVRYHPTFLATITRHGTGDKFLPIVRRLTDIVEDEFPYRVLRYFQSS